MDFKIDKSSRIKLMRGCAIAVLTTVNIIIFPVAVIPLAAAVVLRSVVKVIAAIFRPDLLQIFSGRGIFFALESIYTRPDTNLMIYLFCNNGPIPVEQFRLQFEQRVLNYTDDSGVRPYEKLRQTWTNFMGFIFWKWDSHFKLENHIRLYDYTDPDLALPGKCDENDLKRIAGDLIAKPWVEGRSPWEMLIVQDYRTKKEPERPTSVAIFRIHHGMVDGYGLLTMLLRFADSLNAKRVLPNFPKLSVPQKLMHVFLVVLKMPYDMAEFAVNLFDGPNCWHILWKNLRRKPHVFFSDEIAVEKIKKIRNKYGVGYNETIYSITCGTIRRMMMEAGQKLPESMSVWVPFPLPNHPGGLVCHLSGTGFKFGPKIASAKERISQVGAYLKTRQESPTGVTSYAWFSEVLGLFPTCVLRLMLRMSMMTVVMTSFPGPEVEIPIVGDIKCTSMCGTLGLGHPLIKVGAVGLMTSMNGKQRITLTVDESIFDGYEFPTRFADFVGQEIEQLLNEDEIEKKNI